MTAMDLREAARLEPMRRSLRPDWERWLRPDWERHTAPAERHAMRQEIAARKAAFETAPCARQRLRERQAEIETQLDSPKTLKELQDAVGQARAGTQKHHMVEQGPARAEGFPESQINDPDNLVRISKQRHQEISEWYSRSNKDLDGKHLVIGSAGRTGKNDEHWGFRR
jgi:hypothetical protein